MAVYCVTGKLGSGKTLATVGRIRDALLAGKRVATNLDIFTEHLMPELVRRPDKVQSNLVRLPDKPTVQNFKDLGRGQQGKREQDNGLLVLDEMGSWMNTRDFQDKSRSSVIDWFLHSRKLGWDVYLIIQHHDLLDKQPRQALLEHVVTCRRTDRLRIPFIGGFLKLILGFEPRPPKVHMGTVRYGADPNALVVDRWWYRAKDLYQAYDTNQVFQDDGQVQGLTSMLYPWQVAGRYLPPEPAPWWRQVPQRLRAMVVDGEPWERPARVPLRQRHPVCVLVEKLPPDERWRHMRRLVEGGYLERALR